MTYNTYGFLRVSYSRNPKNKGDLFLMSNNCLNESAENYLETILILSHKLQIVRSVDVANELGYKKSSVSVAMKHLREQSHITVDDLGGIHLTESGKNIADMIYERHTFLSSLLISLGVPEEIALEDACKIEHVISPESIEALKKISTEQSGAFFVV